jgi:hypothetical protein
VKKEDEECLSFLFVTGLSFAADYISGEATCSIVYNFLDQEGNDNVSV